MRCKLPLLLLLVACCFNSQVFSQDYQVVEGSVQEIAADGSYFKIGPTKVLADKKLLAKNFLKIGDDVLVEVVETEKGLEAVFVDFLGEEQ